MLKAHIIDLHSAKSQICALLYRKLELSSVFGPPEREGLHIPESECSALVMILWERRILDHIVPSKICLFDLSRQNRSNRSCNGIEKGRPPQTQIAGEKERGSEKKSGLLFLFRIYISAGLISVWLLHSSKFQTTLALCFQLLAPHNEHNTAITNSPDPFSSTYLEEVTMRILWLCFGVPAHIRPDISTRFCRHCLTENK